MLALNHSNQPIISGAIHYFRSIKSDYRDRLYKLKACGFNTVETYIPWNIHEPSKGNYVFDDYFDLIYFLEVAQSLDLAVIIRPGPYICAEWEMGGLPSWLLQDKNIALRCCDETYLKHVDDWFDVLIPKLVPFQRTHGGPIIAVQVENEYGSYGDDKAYLNFIKEGLIRRGIDVLLFTSDGAPDHMLTGGTLPDVFKTVNFGSSPDWHFAQLRKRQPNAPVTCMEFWDGWFDHWGKPHHTRPSEEVVDVLEGMIKHRAHINFYMFHGGTNFGFYNGANYDMNQGGYLPTTTSYDYNAPLTEAGDITETYLAIRTCLEKHFGSIPYDVPTNTPKKAYGTIQLTQQAFLFEQLDQLATKRWSSHPHNMEHWGQDYGYILYRKNIEGPRQELGLGLLEVRDRAQIFLDGEEQGVYMRNQEQNISFSIPEEGAKLDILVENLGRINYGTAIKDYKGVSEGITLGGCFTFGYTIYHLTMKDLSKVVFNDNIVKTNKPCFYQGTFEVEEVADTFIRFANLTKGFIMINGFNIGRYWNIGPQETLFVPSGLLKQGANQIIVFEQHSIKEPSIESIDHPIYQE